MIIKSGGISAGDGPRITQYAVAEGDNERVEVIRDDNEQLLIADEFAQLKGRKNGLLHIIISPDQKMTDDELKQTVEAINAEFGFNPNDPHTLTMHKHTDADGISRKHWHLVRPAADSETGKTYKLFRSKAKDEAVSRLMELELGHQLTYGPNNQFAEMRLREQGRDELADKLASAFGDQDAPRAAYSSNDHQQAKRQNFDLPALRQQLKELAELPRDQQPAKLAELINDNGLELQDAVETGRGRSRIMIETPQSVKDHNANRTLKVPAAQVAAFIGETKEILNDRKYEHTERTDPKMDGSNDPKPNEFSSESEKTGSTIERDNPDSQSSLESLNAKIDNFAASTAAMADGSDIEALPDIRDPHLLKKLAAILRKQLEKAAALQKKFATAKPPSFAPRL